MEISRYISRGNLEISLNPGNHGLLEISYFLMAHFIPLDMPVGGEVHARKGPAAQHKITSTVVLTRSMEHGREEIKVRGERGREEREQEEEEEGRGKRGGKGRGWRGGRWRGWRGGRRRGWRRTEGLKKK